MNFFKVKSKLKSTLAPRHYSNLFIVMMLSVFGVNAMEQDNNERVQQLDQLFVNHLAKIGSPGFSVAVVEKGELILAKGYGVVSNNKPEKFTENTIIGVGSVTKSFTAMMILQLQEQGLLNVDDLIIKHLPWFRAADKSKSDKITIRMFLNMTSGLEARFSQLTQNQSRRSDALEQGVRNLSSYQITREPGQSFEYVNEGWNTLGLIIETITDKSWEQAFADSVLSPLGMENSSADRKVIEKWQVANGHYAGIKPVPAEFLHVKSSLPAGSGTYSTALDLAQYMKALLSDGRYQGSNILEAKSIKDMWQPATAMSIIPYELGGNEKGGTYGMGWINMEIDGINYTLHGGEFRVSSSLLVMDAKNQSGVVLLYNTGSLDAYNSEADLYAANNALRILKGLPLSDFAVPRQTDPTLNDYLAEEENLAKFHGIYLSKSGKRIDLKAGGSEGLQLYLMESIYPADYDIDFVNENNFIARSNAGAIKGYFVNTTEGDVKSINFSGETFRRKNDDYAGYKPYDLSSVGMTFNLPESWQLSLTPNGFIANDKKYVSATLLSADTPLSYETWLVQIKQQATQQKVIEMTEFKNGYFLQSVIYHDKNGYKQLAMYCNYRGKNYVFTLQGKPESITHLAINVLNPFLSSLSLH
jgi:CubicO group peptidase (beta-lactamase class C family)